MEALATEEQNQYTEFIENFIKNNISKWLSDVSIAKPPQVYEIELRERMIRVEEELKRQRELMMQGFANSDKRFEAMQVQMDKRFEAMDKRFEAMDKRFEEILHYMDKRFEAMQIQMDKRFDAVDKRFDAVDKRFEQVDKRFDALTKRIDRFMIWSFGLTITTTSLIIAFLKFNN